MEDLVDRITENAWMVEVFVILILTAVARFIAKILLDRLVVKSNVTQNVIDDSLVEAGRRPVVFSIWILGICFAAEAVGGAAQAVIFSKQ